jgi:hypothetical protein
MKMDPPTQLSPVPGGAGIEFWLNPRRAGHYSIGNRTVMRIATPRTGPCSTCRADGRWPQPAAKYGAAVPHLPGSAHTPGRGSGATARGDDREAPLRTRLSVPEAAMTGGATAEGKRGNGDVDECSGLTHHAQSASARRAAWRCATSHAGGRPRRGGSFCQSGGGSCRTGAPRRRWRRCCHRSSGSAAPTRWSAVEPG